MPAIDLYLLAPLADKLTPEQMDAFSTEARSYLTAALKRILIFEKTESNWIPVLSSQNSNHLTLRVEIQCSKKQFWPSEREMREALKLLLICATRSTNLPENIDSVGVWLRPVGKNFDIELFAESNRHQFLHPQS